MLAALLLAALLAWTASAAGADLSEYGNPYLWVSVGQVKIKAEAVRTPAKLYLGLSHRPNLPAGRGMLFFMPELQVQHFCMRGMNFPLDFIWIAHGRVAGLTRNVPADFPGNLTSPEPVNYILEVPAGFIDRYRLRVGDRVSWR
jgi:hypothetical protein